MFNKVIAKIFLTATALAPIFPILSFYDWYSGKLLESFFWAITFVALFFLFLYCLHVTKKRLSTLHLTCEQICPVDGEPIAFLLAYTLPFIASPNGISVNLWIMCLFFAMCGTCVYFSNSWTFNPLLNIVGYHFYQVRVKDSVPLILISRKLIRKTDCDVFVAQIDEYIYFDKEK